MRVSVSKVRELIDAVARQRQARAEIMAEVESAERAVRAAADEVSRITQRIGEREAALAHSGDTLPSSLFEEDTQFGLAQRHHRILSLRAEAQRERLKPVAKEIGRIRGEISAAWKQAGENAYRGALSEFRQAAMEVRSPMIELTVLKGMFKVSAATPEVIIQDVTGGLKFIFNNVTGTWLSEHDPEKTTLYAELCAMVKEIEQALSDKPAACGKEG